MTRSVEFIGARGYPSYYGGFETAVRKVAPYLAEEGWDVTVYGRRGGTREDDPTADPRVKSVITGGIESKSISTLSHGLTATWQALKNKPDVALVMNVANGYFLPLLKLRGVKTLVNVDGIEWDRAKWGWAAKTVFKLGAKFTAQFADRVIFDSREVARRWKEEFNREGVFIPYGGEPVEDLPVEAGFEHRGYVLLVARFVPENTVQEFFDVAAEISETLPVVIVGSSGYGGEFDAQAEQLSTDYENIHWFGHISDDQRLLALWQHAAVYYHGHSVGGTNPTLVQAMAAGTPVVARNSPYNVEVLGEDGVYFAPHPEAITAVVLKVAKDSQLQQELSALSKARSQTIYTWPLVCSAYLSELETMSPALERKP